MATKTLYERVESSFESFVGTALKLYGHPITFMVAVILVIFFLVAGADQYQDSHDFIRDLILCISFLSFFIIQKAVNKTTTSIHLKMNELIVSHKEASNEMIKIEEKTETELKEMADKHKNTVENTTGNNT